MGYHESAQKSVVYANAAIDTMTREGIAATPPNFMTWYNYHAGHNPDLCRTLDVLLSNGQPFTADRSAEVFEQFFGTDTETAAVQAVGTRIESAISRIMDAIGDAGDDAEKFGDALKTFSGKLEDGEQPADLRAAISTVLQETRQMEARNRQLEERLIVSSSEVTELRRRLRDTRIEANTDSLTELANRKHFDLRLRELATQAVELGERLSVLLIDIDYFKQFNDEHGHQLGDHALKLVALTIRANVKERDVTARYGGEEFAVILRGTMLDEAEIVAERLREAVASRQFVRTDTGQNLGKVTMSIGVAEYRYGEPLDELVERADRALYLAKGGGRDRVASELALEAPIPITG